MVEFKYKTVQFLFKLEVKFVDLKKRTTRLIKQIHLKFYLVAALQFLLTYDLYQQVLSVIKEFGDVANFEFYFFINTLF